MKKIVGILAAAAVATSVFAADVSASTKINGKLFSYDNAKTFTLFTENNDSHDYANPNITFSVSDDKAGATVKLSTDGKDKAVKMTTQTIWFKPVDAFKVTVGNFDVALNKEQIKWTESVTGLGGNGFLFSVNVEGFGLDLGLSKANGVDWLTKKDGEDDPAIFAFFLKAGYSADFGNIGAFVEFNRCTRDKSWAGHDYLFTGYYRDGVFTPEAGFAPKDGAIADILFGAGYNNNFDGVNLAVNVNGYMADKFEWVRPEIYVSGSADAFGYAAFVAPTIFMDSDYKDAIDQAAACQVLAKVSYKLDAATVYARFDDVDVLAKKFTSEIRIGAEGSVGAMGYNVWFQINTGKGAAQDKVDLSIPFELTMNF